MVFSTVTVLHIHFPLTPKSITTPKHTNQASHQQYQTPTYAIRPSPQLSPPQLQPPPTLSALISTPRFLQSNSAVSCSARSTTSVLMLHSYTAALCSIPVTPDAAIAAIIHTGPVIQIAQVAIEQLEMQVEVALDQA